MLLSAFALFYFTSLDPLIGFTFLVPAHPGSPGCVCVCSLEPLK